MSVEEFMAYNPSMEEGELEGKEQDDSTLQKCKSHKEQLNNLEEADPEFYKFLLKHDDKLLKFSDSEEDECNEDNESTEEQSEERDITDEEEVLSSNDESEREGLNDKDEGEIVTVEMVHKWSQRLKNSNSLGALKQLLSALHCGIVTTLSTPDEQKKVIYEQPYQVRGQVFNSLVIACLRYVRPTIEHHLPLPSSITTKKLILPSSLKSWGRLRSIIKLYLADILQLLKGVSQDSMICAILRHIEGIWIYFCCFPKLSRLLSHDLIKIWSERQEEAAVLAYLILRKLITTLNEYKIEDLMKRMHLSYVRNSRFTGPSTLPHIHFMCGTLVEIFSVSPNLAYQLIFVYTRQLANQLRTAYEGKKVTISTWPFIHSLALFTATLSSLQTEILSPLVFPVTQVALGVVQLLRSVKHTPTRLHIVKMLLDISEERDTYIPLAPILLEILETQSLSISRKAATGKPPNLSFTLKLSKAQIGSRSSQTSILNSTMELLLRLLTSYSHCISFPELAFPIITRVRKVMKKTPLTWLKQHLRQIVDKTEDVSRSITHDRSTVTFGPKDAEMITAWEQQYRQRPNALKKFLETWKKVQLQTEPLPSNREDEEDEEDEDSEVEEQERKKRKRKSQTSQKSTKHKRTIPSFQLVDVSDDEDVVEELQLSSDEG